MLFVHPCMSSKPKSDRCHRNGIFLRIQGRTMPTLYGHYLSYTYVGECTREPGCLLEPLACFSLLFSFGSVFSMSIVMYSSSCSARGRCVWAGRVQVCFSSLHLFIVCECCKARASERCSCVYLYVHNIKCIALHCI